jgi:hypothetical protein
VANWLSFGGMSPPGDVPSRRQPRESKGVVNWLSFGGM